MKNIRYSFISGTLFTGCLIVLASCISPYEFESEETLETIVVEGLLTDHVDHNYINLFNTRAFNHMDEDPVTNAVVSVESSDGNLYVYTHEGDGNYRPPAGFIGTPGESYVLNIDIEGEVYYTDSNPLIPSNETGIVGRAVNIPDPEVGQNVDGVQFFVESTEEPTASHFRFEWEDTYRIIVPFAMRYEYVDGVIEEIDENVGICYRTESSDQILVESILQQTDRSLREFPVRFMREGLQAYRTRYSLLVRQFTLTSEAYGYFDKLKKNNEGGGSLFDKQTGPLLGNIKNDNQKIALGYFQVSGVSEIREFYSLHQFGDQLSVPRFQPNCPETMIVSTIDSVGILQKTGWRLFGIEETGPSSVVYLMNFGACSDCRLLGDPNRPEWWED